MGQTVKVYGIKTCTTVRKALSWLEEHGVAVDFHDYKKNGVPQEALKRWVAEWGWEAVLNRAGTTFRALSDAEKEGLDEGRAIQLMMAYPSLIRRPIMEWNGWGIIRFSPETYKEFFSQM